MEPCLKMSLTNLTLNPIAERVAAVQKAIEDGDVSEVQSVLSKYPDLSPNSDLPGLTMPLLHLATGLSNNSPEIVELLLKHGGDPNRLATEAELSPCHLAVICDFEVILARLMQHGGDPNKKNGEGKTCYDLVKDNLEAEMLEKCFLYFYKRSGTFRKSIMPSDLGAKIWQSSGMNLSSCTEGDGFVTCDSDFEPVAVQQVEPEPVEKVATPKASERETSKDSSESGGVVVQGTNAQWCKGMYLMTEDESDDSKGRLSTIEEESFISVSLQKKLGYEETKDASIYYESFLTDISSTSTATTENIESEPSCANSTPPILPSPSKMEILQLQMKMKEAYVNPPIPVTQSTYRIVSKFAAKQGPDQLAQAVAPKQGVDNFSSELKLSLCDLTYLDEWGNLKIDFLQDLNTPCKKSKSFYNYLLLDPKVIKRSNFSGNHLKSDVIKNAEKFETFLKSVFYIGKGCGKRPIQHLVDAKEKYGTGRKVISVSYGDKIDRILDIWKSGLGVLVVSMFHYSSEREANAYEAAMIDAMGLVELSNIKKGSYAGTPASKWPQKTKNQFGSFLLYKSFCAFAVSDHKSFSPQDI